MKPKHIAFVLLMAWAIAHPLVFAATPLSPKVLIIWSYDEKLPWQRRVHAGLESRLTDRRKEVAPLLFEETLDAIRLDDKVGGAWWVDFLRRKYADIPFDMVITESGPAAHFLSNYPTLFDGAKRFIVNSDKILDKKIGIQLAVEEDFEQHMKVALDLQPAARRLVVIGNLLPDRVQQARKMWEAHFKKRVSFEAWTDDFSFPELYSRAAGLPKDTVILYELVSHDRTGAHAVPYEILEKLTSVASVPVFATHDTLMGSGAVGGFLLSGERVGRMMADLMAGAPPESFPNDFFSIYQFDGRVLNRWDISDASLPAGSQILYREPPLWETHGKWIVFIALETLLLLALGWSLLGRYRAFVKLREMAAIDSLTGVCNRREFFGRMENELARIQRFESAQAAVLMLDIDHFKGINDTQGHLAGDAALAQLGAILKRNARRIDTVGRIGGEEFAIVLVGTDVEEGTQFAERLRAAVAETPVMYEGHRVDMTVSIGVSSISPADGDSATALARADRALYLAKDQGRNCVVTVSDSPSGVNLC